MESLSLKEENIVKDERNVLLDWCEYTHVFIILPRVNSRFVVSIQSYFSVIIKLRHLHCDKLPLQSTCLNSQFVLGGGIRNRILVCFYRFYSDKMTALEYAFIVF